MATAKVRAACKASVGVLAPELPCTLDLGAGNPLPAAANPTSTISTNLAGPRSSPIIHTRPLEDGKDARPASAGSGVSVTSTGSPKHDRGGKGGSGNGVTKGLKRARMVLKTAAELSQTEREELFSLWKENMGHYANLEYTDSGKWEEMYDPDARYLIIRRQADRSPSTSPLSRTLKLASAGGIRNKEKEREREKYKENGKEIREGENGKESREGEGGEGEKEGRKRRRMRRPSKDQDEGELLGFASFRFDTEETMGAQDAEVVYCYELQLSVPARGLGLARRLMDALEGIGRRRGMAKSMLTCLVANTSALGFYKRQGYTPDEIDPTRCAEEEGEEADYSYRILSKAL